MDVDIPHRLDLIKMGFITFKIKEESNQLKWFLVYFRFHFCIIFYLIGESTFKAI